MKVLICGATGFIGRNLVEFFSKKKNIKITATYNKRPKYKTKGVRWIKCDLRNEKKVNKILKDIDCVIQAAATTSGSKDIINTPEIHVTDNAVMNSYIFKYSRINNVKHVIFFSCTVMLQSKIKPQKETEYDISKTIYPNYFGVGWTKIFLEKQCEFYSRISKTKYTAIRHSNIYGPHDKFDLEKSHFFGANVTKVLKNKGKSLLIWGKGDEKRDLLYVSDLINFVWMAIKNQKSNFELLNCGYGKSFKVKDVIKKIIFFSGKKMSIKHDLYKTSLNTNVSLDCRKAKKVIGWKKKVSLNDGITRTLKWYKKNVKI